MSKAFTKESDSEANDDSIPRRKLASGSHNLITAAGAKRFRAEIEKLTAEKQAVEAAGNDGSGIKSRIRQLQDLLQSSTIAELPVDRESIAFGALVILRYPNGETIRYEIVGPEEIDPANDRISVQSPLGRALIGRKAGDTFRFRAPAGEQDLEIITVAYD